MSGTSPYVYAATLAAPRGATLVQYYVEAEDGMGNTALYPDDGGISPASVFVGDADTSPVVEHAPIRSCLPGQALEVRARITSQAPLRWARLYYRDLNQKQTWVATEMEEQDGEYVASIPGEDITAQWDLMYYIEAMDVLGNAVACPDLDLEQPYWVVEVAR